MFPAMANAGPRPPQILCGPLIDGYGIWYARSELVKARHHVEMLKISAT
jgi:hypothetical protein